VQLLFASAPEPMAETSNEISPQITAFFMSALVLMISWICVAMVRSGSGILPPVIGSKSTKKAQKKISGPLLTS
jgi:hypothetical protein